MPSAACPLELKTLRITGSLAERLEASCLHDRKLCLKPFKLLLLLVVTLEVFEGKILRLERISQTVIHLELVLDTAVGFVVLGEFVSMFAEADDVVGGF